MMMQKLFKISQQTFWQVVVKLITTTSGFVILGVVARTYGETGTGSFTLALTYLAFFYILSDFGFNAHLLGKLQAFGSEADQARRSTGNKLQKEWRKLLGTRILWSILLIFIALILLVFFSFNPPSYGFSPDFKLAVILGSITILFFAINITAHSLLQAKLRYDLDILPTLLGVVLGTLLIIILAPLGVPVYYLILGYVVAWFVHSLGTILATKKFVSEIKPIFDLGYLKKLFIEVWPMAATLVLNVVYFRVDAFILFLYHPTSQVGIYNIAYQVFQALLVLPTFIMNAFYPMMLETLKVKADRFLRQLKLAFLSLTLISVLVLLVTYLLSPFIIKVITGSGFSGSEQSLRVLSLGLPAYFLSSLMMWVMVAKKRYQAMVVVYAIGLIFNLIANLVFIPQYSFIAAAWITGISEYLILILQFGVLFLKR